MNWSRSLAAVALLVLLSNAGVRAQRKLGEMDAVNPGFTTVYEDTSASDPRDRYSLILSSFNPIPLTTDYLFRFPNPGRNLDNPASAERVTITTDLLWPREPGVVPMDVFGFRALAQPDGFIPPGKNVGSVRVIDVRDWSNPIVHDVTSDSPGETEDWFYHRATWKDIDLDGRKDLLINRARVDLIDDSKEFQLVWFKHPETEDIFAEPWETGVLRNNVSDTFIFQARLKGGDQEYDVVFTVGYFTQILAVHWSTNPRGAWDNPADIQTRIIGTLGKYFDVEVVDVNNDGRLDLLTTLNAENNGSMHVYEIPDDFRTGNYIRHKLADGFNARSGLDNGGSPGQANAFYRTTDTSGKPTIMCSGDDEGTAYLLTPSKPNDPNDWQYEKTKFIDLGEGNIIGRLAAFDADGDGYTELFVPAWTEDKVQVFTFAPEL